MAMIYDEFIESDIRVFPLWGITADGSCGCGDAMCPAAGKHPRTANWQNAPEWSEDQIEAMEESGQFDTGYGVVVSGLLVIDVDERNDGAESYIKLADSVPGIASAGLSVRTGSGGESKHLYFRIETPLALVQHLADYPGIDFKSSGFVVGPGSRHKSGNTYDVLHGDPSDIDAAPEALVELLRKPERHRANMDGQAVDVSTGDIADMLSAISPDIGHETWIRCGMAAHHASAGEALEQWDEWSAKGGKYPGRGTIEKRWHSFGKSTNPVTLSTLAHYAEEAGWVAPVEFTSDLHFEVPEEATLDTEGVDLLRPPGFVGTIAAWINGRNRHPRETLSVAAAIATISSIAGMRYIDPLDGITPNVFLFGVSGSATGKESVLKSHTELLRVAGLSPAVHGGFKSEQEIYRNLIRHQAALYVVDELGEVLSKISNARKRGGTSPYLEGIIGALLSVYSKADGHALITGDLKAEVSKALYADIAALEKRMDKGENEGDEEKLADMKKRVANIDQGLENPYLCIYGLTTPERFDGIMDPDMAANGFLGRSLIFRELDDNPKAKSRSEYSKKPVPDAMAATLQNLYAPGRSETPARVERVGEISEVQTRPDAIALMDKVGEHFWELAERVKEASNLTPIPRRGYEQVAKVSMLLAIPSGVRTVEHVRWALALVKRDVDEKIKLAQSNNEDSKEDALIGRILSLMTKEHGETIGRIRNKCRAYRPEDVDKCVKRLEEASMLSSEDIKPARGRPSTKYFLA